MLCEQRQPRRSTAAFAILDSALEPGPYLLGEAFSAVDIYLSMFSSWHSDPVELRKNNPRLAQLSDRVEARPAVGRVASEHGD
jgi:glutathione S-transferase